MESSKNFAPTLLHRLALPLLLAAGLLLPAHAFPATIKPVPRGIYDLLFGAPGTGRIDLTGNPLLDNPSIDGFRYKTGWAKIQPTSADTYNWASIDAAIAMAAAHGKKMCVSIAAGFSTPDWVYTTAPVVYKYSMIETDPTTGLSIGNQPLPWDTAYQDKWLKFLAAFGAHYENNPACSYVVIGGFMQTFNLVVTGIDADTNGMEALAQHPPTGYPGLVTSYADFSSAYLPAAQKVIDAFHTNFVTTPLLLTLTRVIPGDIGVTDQNAVADYGKNTYPGQVGTMVSALYAVIPPHPAPPAPLPYPKGLQMVGKASDAARLYIDPDPVPLPAAPIPLQDALEHGVSLGGQFVEVYEDDLLDSRSQPVLDTESVKLRDNVPPDGVPAAPTNLRITP